MRVISSRDPILKFPKPVGKPPKPNRNRTKVEENLFFNLPQPPERECHASQKRERESAHLLCDTGRGPREEEKPLSSEPKREHTEPETFESDIRDHQSAGLDRIGFEIRAKFCGPVPEGIKRLLNDENPVVRALRKPRAVRRLTDKHKVTTRIEPASTADCGFHARLFTRNEYDNARRRLVRRY